MSVPEVDIWRIESALSEAAWLAESYRNNARGASAYDYARQAERTIADAQREFSKLSAVWSRAKSLMQEADRAYDRHVLSRGQSFDEDRTPESCSCHINPPCSFCTSQPDQNAEEDAEA